MRDVPQEIVPGMADAIATRMRQLKLTPTTLAERTGLTVQGLIRLRKGERRAYQDRLKLPVAEALRWTPDSIDRLLRGEPPIELGSTTPAGVGGDGELRAQVEALTEGAVAASARLDEVLARLAEVESRLQEAERRRRRPPSSVAP